MKRIAMGIEYHGASFRGWQTQPGGGTVQDALQTALAKIAGERVDVVCAGRTDAGVHATGQVVHFDTELERPLTAWVRGARPSGPWRSPPACCRRSTTPTAPGSSTATSSRATSCSRPRAT